MYLTISVPPNDLGDARTGDLEIRQVDSHLSSPRTDLNLSSPRTDSQLLTPRTDSHLLSPRTFPNIGWGVDVEAAEAEFQRLSRWFMLLTDPASRRRRPSRSVGDLEEAGDIGDDTGKFNLEDYLRGNEGADQGSERRPKHIGETSIPIFRVVLANRAQGSSGRTSLSQPIGLAALRNWL